MHNGSETKHHEKAKWIPGWGGYNLLEYIHIFKEFLIKKMVLLTHVNINIFRA